MSQELSVVGKRLAQPDGVAKATGAAQYAADIKLPGMLIARVLRSPYPHAKVIKIDTSKAQKLPGVEAVITAADVPRKGYLTYTPRMASVAPPLLDRHILEERARYVGDCIAAVAATDRWIAEEALELIEVEYEKLPAVFDIEEALKPGAPRIDNIAENNIACETVYPLAKGNVEKGFAESDCIVEETFSTKPQEHCVMEPHTCVATCDANGNVTCWTTCQLAHSGQRTIADLFDIPLGKVRLVNPFVGGSFGQRLTLFSEPIAIALAMKTGKPVKLEYTMEEDFAVMNTRPAFEYTVKMGFKKDGTLTAMDLDLTANAGGYRGAGALITILCLFWGLGAYRCPNRAGRARAVFTNIQATCAFRGAGNPEVMFGVDQVMDMAAEKLGIDPVEIRLKNIKKVGELSNMGTPIESTAQEECIKLGAERIGWKEKRGRRKEGVVKRGIGMGTMQHSSGAFPSLLEHSSAFLKFNEDGSANLIVHPGSPGTGIWGALSQIAAEELGIRAEDIHIVTGDTAVTMFEVGSHASRSVYVIGNAVLHAAQQAKWQLLEKAAKMLGASSRDLEIKDRQIYDRTALEKRISVAEVCEDAATKSGVEVEDIYGKATWHSRSNPPPLGAFFAEVEVDTETRAVRLIRFVTAADSGKPINPMTVEGQYEGSVQQLSGYALTEDWYINKDTGVLETDSFATYKMPSQLDMPEIEVILTEKPEPSGPFGAKGAGEPGGVGVASAIANAIYDAIGVRMKDLPITPEKIVEALKSVSAQTKK